MNCDSLFLGLMVRLRDRSRSECGKSDFVFCLASPKTQDVRNLELLPFTSGVDDKGKDSEEKESSGVSPTRELVVVVSVLSYGPVLVDLYNLDRGRGRRKIDRTCPRTTIF